MDSRVVFGKGEGPEATPKEMERRVVDMLSLKPVSNVPTGPSTRVWSYPPKTRDAVSERDAEP